MSGGGPGEPGSPVQPPGRWAQEDVRPQAQDGQGLPEIRAPEIWISDTSGAVSQRRGPWGPVPSLPVHTWVFVQTYTVAAKKHSSNPPKPDERKGRGS